MLGIVICGLMIGRLSKNGHSENDIGIICGWLHVVFILPFLPGVVICGRLGYSCCIDISETF